MCKVEIVFVLALSVFTPSIGHNSPHSTDIFVAAEHADSSKGLSPSLGVGVPEKVGIGTVDPESKTKPKVDPMSSNEDKEIIIEVNHRRYDDAEYRTPSTTPPPPTTSPISVISDGETEDVIFIKNEREVERNGDRDDYYPRENVVRMKDLLREPKHGSTAAPRSDIMFISGKNNENLEKNEIKNSPKPDKHLDSPKTQEPGRKIKQSNEKLDCSSTIECNGTIESVCGERNENNYKKYRMFLNDCYYRKVNCDFKHEFNRYRKVALDKCQKIAGRHSVTIKPVEFRAFAPFNDPTVGIDYRVTRKPETRRFMDGRQCSHPCPTICPEGYAPECAVGINGNKRVFANHCEMDRNSCTYGTAWQKRPLSFCVGTMKADLQENRRWINWLQRTGIVDKKGRLVLN